MNKYVENKPQAANPSAETKATTRSSAGGLWRRLRKAYAAHEARLAQLRVYDRRL